MTTISKDKTRPKSTTFYANSENTEFLNSFNKGDRSRIINKALMAFNQESKIERDSIEALQKRIAALELLEGRVTAIQQRFDTHPHNHADKPVRKP